MNRIPLILTIFILIVNSCASPDKQSPPTISESDLETFNQLGVEMTSSMSEAELFQTWAESTYEELSALDEETGNKRRRRRATISEVEEPTPADPTELPDWITSKQYVSENVDAIKYQPSVLIGAIARTYDNSTFEVYPITKNIKKDGVNPELNWIETPTNYYEETFDQSSRFNTGFLIGNASIAANKALSVSYKETAYLVLDGGDIDPDKLQLYKKQITENENLNPDDFSIVRGIVIVDCTNSSYSKVDGSVDGSFKWLSIDGALHKADGVENNFRMISIDLEKLFAF